LLVTYECITLNTSPSSEDAVRHVTRIMHSELQISLTWPGYSNHRLVFQLHSPALGRGILSVFSLLKFDFSSSLKTPTLIAFDDLSKGWCHHQGSQRSRQTRSTSGQPPMHEGLFLWSRCPTRSGTSNRNGRFKSRLVFLDDFNIISDCEPSGAHRSLLVCCAVTSLGIIERSCVGFNEEMLVLGLAMLTSSRRPTQEQFHPAIREVSRHWGLSH